MENILIGSLFLGAVYYLATQVSSSLKPTSSGCAKNCGGACKVPTFDAIEMMDKA